MPYTVESHGSSGRWYPHSETFFWIADALLAAAEIKSDGYGTRIIRADGSVAMSAPWQDEIDWSIAC